MDCGHQPLISKKFACSLQGMTTQWLCLLVTHLNVSQLSQMCPQEIDRACHTQWIFPPVWRSAKALEHISSLLTAHNRLNEWPRSAKTLKYVGNLLTEHGGHSRCASVDASQCQQVPHVRKCLMKKGRLSECVYQCEGQQRSQMRQYSLYGKWRTLLMCLLV